MYGSKCPRFDQIWVKQFGTRPQIVVLYFDGKSSFFGKIDQKILKNYIINVLEKDSKINKKKNIADGLGPTRIYNEIINYLS